MTPEWEAALREAVNRHAPSARPGIDALFEALDGVKLLRAQVEAKERELIQRLQHALDRQQELAEGFMKISQNHAEIAKLLSNPASAGRAEAFKQASYAVQKMVFVERDR